LIALCRTLEWRIEEGEQDGLAESEASGQQQPVKRSLTRSTKLLASSRTNKRAGVMRPSARNS
jgi:hypothetical protein